MGSLRKADATSASIDMGVCSKDEATVDGGGKRLKTNGADDGGVSGVDNLLDMESLRRCKDDLARLPPVDEVELRLGRQRRLQEQMRLEGLDGVLLYDPINLRYACGVRNMQIWTMHNKVRYCFLPKEGKAILFDFFNCEHLADEGCGRVAVGEVRYAKHFLQQYTGGSHHDRRQEMIKLWAEDLLSVIVRCCGKSPRIAVDIVDPDAQKALESLEVKCVPGEKVCEMARCIKTPQELIAQRHSARVCQEALGQMRRVTQPGITENQVWGVLCAVNAMLGGDYIETRLVTSGERTNPLYYEASERVLQEGDLLMIDTDMIGPWGYNTDISRTWRCPPGSPPTAAQKELYSLAYEQVHHNMGLLKAGVTFREVSQKCWRIPEKYSDLEVCVVLHGEGLRNEYPNVYPWKVLEAKGEGMHYDGQFEENMTVCIESYIGEKGGREGVKLEEMVRITKTGVELIARFPFEDTMLGPTSAS